MAGPLRGLRVLEFAGLGPAPFACMLLSDMGAEVVCVDRPQARLGDARNVMQRGRTVVQADLKSPEGRGQAAELAARADVLVEGFRPGVLERLGLGPDAQIEEAQHAAVVAIDELGGGVLVAALPRLEQGRVGGQGVAHAR